MAEWLCTVISAENLVAAFQQQPLQVFVYADSYQNGRVLLEALETGVDGVVLRTADVKEVCTTALLVKNTIVRDHAGEINAIVGGHAGARQARKDRPAPHPASAIVAALAPITSADSH